MTESASNLLYYGDNLDILRREMPPIRQVQATFKKAPKSMEKQSRQSELQM